MSTPGQGEGPRYDPYGQRGSGSGPGQQGAYGSPPPYGQPGQYAYNPYAPPPYPAGTDAGSPVVKRPGIMVLSLVLLVFSTLLFLLVGVVLLALPLDPATLAPLLARVDPQNQLDPAQLVLGLRIIGGVFTAIAVLYILFAVLAFTGRNWARIVLTVLTVGFVLLVAAGLVNGAGGDAASLGLGLVVLGAAVVGTVILYLPGPAAYFARPRR